MADLNRVAYVCHGDYTKQSDNFIPTSNRNAMVHSLIEAYGLLGDMMVVTPKLATRNDLEGFHSVDYLNHLEKCEDSELAPSSEEDEECGIGYDCPSKDGIMDYCHRVAGGTIDAARHVNNDSCKIAMHWLGGWHHAKRSNAAGFCYVNDCVLGIIELRKKYNRVLYVDLDLHHGDGVEDAFCATDKVVTLSFHKFEPGFFPGSGSVSDIGHGRGKYHTVNVPLLNGIRDENFCEVFDRIFPLVCEKFNPDALLCQCGVDGLNGDPMRSFNLTPKSFVHCIRKIIDLKLPMVLLGGGGYNSANAARCWAIVTAAVLGKNLPDEIPDQEYFTEYGPDFGLCISESYIKDDNTKAYVAEVCGRIESNLSNV